MAGFGPLFATSTVPSRQIYVGHLILDEYPCKGKVSLVSLTFFSSKDFISSLGPLICPPSSGRSVGP
jgi:hypothetical protein